MSSPGLIYKAIADVMSSINAVGKDQRNTMQNFNFRGIDQVYNEVHPRMVNARIFSAPEVLENHREERTTKNGGTATVVIMKIRYRFFAEDGSFVDVTVIGEGADSGDKASNKAMAIAHKYAILQLLMIPTKDMAEADKESFEFTSKGSRPDSQPKGNATKAGGTPPPASSSPSANVFKQMREQRNEGPPALDPNEPMPDFGPPPTDMDPLDAALGDNQPTAADQTKGPAKTSKAKGGPGDYVMPFGKTKGTPLRELKRFDLENSRIWVNDEIKKSGKPPSAMFKKFLEQLDLWLNFGDSPADQPPKGAAGATQNASGANNPGLESKALKSSINRASIVAVVKRRKWSYEHVSEFIQAAFGVDSSSKLTDQQFGELLAAIEGMTSLEAIKLARETKGEA